MWEWPRHHYTQNTVAKQIDLLSRKVPSLFPPAKLPEAASPWKVGQAGSRGWFLKQMSLTRTQPVGGKYKLEVPPESLQEAAGDAGISP